MKFTCDYNNDNNETIHPYPRASGAYNSTNSKQTMHMIHG